MKKTFLISAIVAGLSITSLAANAGEHTISAGYAQSKINIENNNLKTSLKGFNVKYRYEFNEQFGLISSFTHTGYNTSYDDPLGYHGGSLDYNSITIGPSYRFNEYISAYALIGAGVGKASNTEHIRISKYNSILSFNDDTKTAVAYGAGVQFNPLPNVAIDASYEYTKLDSINLGTWVLGVGYRF
ncbi:Ail/Lom family outer membrane beta-barrel protein [Xenorhabdus eapokensis]|uniref:Attachment invasion locus protein n=1 Tax=Xenorhabdus eapokensis TaxID=1873482 RepID=A0A1Q5TV75_9GAMM|nr:Ail/Lom family outer membrane beta-barrel protein [Xenorhabdus eapokensis]OKP03082.1 attachment invasion locus protein [Xenorhabdus eapokensis]OKP04145.1 attachment invasion locus protein [Xenorhabdus eapokensis]